MRSAAAMPSADAWNCAPTLRSGRYSSGASSSTVSPASSPRSPADELHPDRRRHQRRAEHRQQLQHQRRQEPDAQRPHRLAAQPVARHGDRLHLRARPARSPAASPDRRTMSRKCADRRDSVSPAGRAFGARSGVPISTMKTGISGTVTARIAAASRSRGNAQARIAGGDERRERDLRQVAREVRLQRVDPLDGGGRELAAAFAGQRPGARAQQVPDERAAQLVHHAGRADPPGRLEAGDHEPARQGERREPYAARAGRRPGSPRP